MLDTYAGNGLTDVLKPQSLNVISIKAKQSNIMPKQSSYHQQALYRVRCIVPLLVTAEFPLEQNADFLPLWKRVNRQQIRFKRQFQCILSENSSPLQHDSVSFS